MPPSPSDLAALQSRLAGRVLLPSAPSFEWFRRPPIARFHDIRPQAVARCVTHADVAEVISFVRQQGMNMATRSGGHCFAGRSSTRGILIDVSQMTSRCVVDGMARVGPGVRLDQLYDTLEPHGLTIAAGCGPTVGVAGLTLGGGFGILGRKHGLTCDQLVRAQLVLADGRMVECDQEHEAELFWARRGAGGCQFGIVTQLAFRTVPTPPTTTLHLIWPHGNAAAIIEAWQQWAPNAPDELSASLLVTASRDASEPPAVHVVGALLGPRYRAAVLLGELVERAGVQPESTRCRELPFRAAKRDLVEDDPAPEMSPRDHRFCKSEFFRQPLPRGAIDALLEHVCNRRTPGQVRALEFTPWGGAYNRIRADATAFAHRAERFLLKQEVVVAGDAPGEHWAAQDWVARAWALVHACGSGGVYPNFPNPDLEDWASAYHSTNYDRLLRVKATYDPCNLFRFDQSLPVRPTASHEPRRLERKS